MEGPLDNIKALYPLVDERYGPVPRAWSLKDRSDIVFVEPDGLTVFYKSRRNLLNQIGCIRTVHPIPTMCGVYYFEIKVTSKGKEGYTAIGLSPAGTSLKMLPGWDTNSYGYHGDDGMVYTSSICDGTLSGPSFTTGDVVGCCVNFVLNEVYFTKNGVALGRTYEYKGIKLHPMVGMTANGQQIECNFGSKPFCFHFGAYVRLIHRETLEEICSYPLPSERSKLEISFAKLVLSYLTHNGYSTTAEAFAAAANLELPASLTPLRNRKRVQRLVMQGRIEQVLELIEELYPGMLEQFPDLYFMLKVRQLVERISCAGTCSEESASGSETAGPSASSSQQSSSTPSRGTDAIGSAPSGSSNETMECDEEPSVGRIPKGSDTVICRSMPGFPRPRISVSDKELLKIIEFGRELYGLRQRLEEKHKRKLKSSYLLEDAAELLAYADPWSSPFRFQLQPRSREAWAGALNSTVLDFEGLARPSMLQLFISYAHWNLKMLNMRLKQGWITVVSPLHWVTRATLALNPSKSKRVPS